MRYGMWNRALWTRGLRRHLGDTQSAFATRLGVKQATASRWEKGAEPKSQHWDALKLLALKEGYAQPDEATRPTCPLIGFVGAGTEINLFGNGQGPFDEVDMPLNGNDKTVAVEVRGESMSGWADDRWLLYYDNVQEPPSDGLIGKLCVVALDNDRRLTKKLLRGHRPGHYDLWSSNAPPLVDQRVLWAAEILWIKPR